ncbi:22239_t:CDS:2, partial [Racocetra persica]
TAKLPAIAFLTDSSSTIAAATVNSYDHKTFHSELKPIKAEILPVLSLHNRLNQWEETQINLKLTLQRRIYGIHAPLRHMIEQSEDTHH